MARIPYFDLSQVTPELAQQLDERPKPLLNYFRMLAHGGSVAVGFLQLGGAILRKSEIDPRLRELAILRTAANSGSAYELHQHKRIAVNAGVSAEKIEAVIDLSGPPREDLFDEGELLLIRFTDELVRDVKASDETFSRMCQKFPYRQVMEFVLTCGFYMAVARYLETFEVDIEED